MFTRVFRVAQRFGTELLYNFGDFFKARIFATNCFEVLPGQARTDSTVSRKSSGRSGGLSVAVTEPFSLMRYLSFSANSTCTRHAAQRRDNPRRRTSRLFLRTSARFSAKPASQSWLLTRARLRRSGYSSVRRFRH